VTTSQTGDKIALQTLGFSEFKNVFTTSFYLKLEGYVFKLLHTCPLVLCHPSHLL